MREIASGLEHAYKGNWKLLHTLMMDVFDKTPDTM